MGVDAPISLHPSLIQDASGGGRGPLSQGSDLRKQCFILILNSTTYSLVQLKIYSPLSAKHLLGYEDIKG